MDTDNVVVAANNKIDLLHEHITYLLAYCQKHI